MQKGRRAPNAPIGKTKTDLGHEFNISIARHIRLRERGRSRPRWATFVFLL